MSTYKRGNYFVACLLLYMPLGSSIIRSLIFNLLSFRMDAVGQLILSLTLGQGLILLIPILIFKFLTVQSYRCFIPVKGFNLINLLLVILICIFIQPFMMMVSMLSSAFFPNTTGAMFEQVNVIPFWAKVLGIAVIPAVFEEIIMRGMILSEHRALSFKHAIIINGLFFGFMHPNPQKFVYAFLLGAIFAAIVRITGNIIYTIVGHFIINLSQLLLFEVNLPLATEASNPTEAVPEPFLNIALLIIGSVAITGILIQLLKIYNKRKRECNNFETNEFLSQPETKQPIFSLSLWAVVIAYFISLNI